MSLSPCHSEVPVLWGPKNPCSFFERQASECSSRTAEILRRPDQIGTPQDDIPRVCTVFAQLQLPSLG